MKIKLKSHVLTLLLLAPLLTGCGDGDDDDDMPEPTPEPQPEPEPEPSGFNAFFSADANAAPVPVDDADALRSDIEALFGESNAEPQEPEAVIGDDT